MSKGKKRSGARPGRPQPLRGTKGKRKGARLWYEVVNNFNCRGFGPLLEDKLCLIFKLAPSVCRITFPILASFWSDWSSYYHFNYSGYRWRLLRDGRRWRSPSFFISTEPAYSQYYTLSHLFSLPHPR